VTPGDGGGIVPGAGTRDAPARGLVVAQVDRGSPVPDRVTYTPRTTGFASLLFFPQHLDDGGRDLRYAQPETEEEAQRDHDRRPAVVRVEAWGAQSGREWTYTEDPSSSRVPGGTSAGGIVFMPPELDLADRGDDLAPTGVSTSTGYVAMAPGVYLGFGVPTADGDLDNCGWRQGKIGDDWILQGKASDAWADYITADKSTGFVTLKHLRIEDTAWDDLRFPAQGINPPGAVSDPAVNASTGLLEFSKSATNTIAGVAQMPHSWKAGTSLEPHIHWFGFTAPGGSTDVRWQLEYEVVEINGAWDGATYSNTLAVTAAVTEDTHLYTELGEISMAGISSVSCMIFWKLSRLGGDPADDYDDVATLGEFDIHYQVDSLGSDQEASKT
jgi:hypothetical protein